MEHATEPAGGTTQELSSVRFRGVSRNAMSGKEIRRWMSLCYLPCSPKILYLLRSKHLENGERHAGAGIGARG